MIKLKKVFEVYSYGKICSRCLSKKYIYDRNNLISESNIYSYVDSNATYSAYENNYFLNIAFPVSNKIIEWDASLYDSPVDAQAELFKLATGIDEIFIKQYSYDFNNGFISCSCICS